MALSSIFFPGLTNPTKIGSIEVDILIEQEYSLESEVTEHPVEDGFPVADHVIRRPVKVSMVVGVSATPVTWLDRLGSDPDKVGTALAAFEQIYRNAQPVTIITPSNVWETMVMTSAKFPRNLDNKNIMKIPCEFTKIRKVTVKTATIPENIVSLDMINRAGETGANGGAAKQTELGGVNESTGGEQPEVRRSTLRSLKSSLSGG